MNCQCMRYFKLEDPAMKKFLSYVAIYGMIVVVIFGTLEFIVRRQPNEFKMKNDYMIKNAESIRTLLVGHSGMLRGLDPNYMSDSTYNSAIDNQSLEYSAFIVRHYAPLMKNLKVVVLSCNYLDVYFHMTNKISCYQIYMDGDLYPWYSIYNFECLGNTRRFCGKVINIVYRPNNFSFKENGYLENPESKINTDIKGNGSLMISSTNKQEADPDKKVKFANNVKALKEIAQYCKDNNLTLCLMSTPSCSSYNEGMRKSHTDKLNEMVQEAMFIYPNVKYWDFHDDDNFNDDDFLDAVHLNTQSGAPKLSRIVQDRINQLQIR